LANLINLGKSLSRILLALYFCQIADLSARSDEPADLVKQFNEYQSAAEFKRAETIARRLVELAQTEKNASRIAAGRNLLGMSLSNQSRYAEAASQFELSIALWQQSSDPNLLGEAETMANLALAYQNQARYTEAEQLYLRALAIQERVLGNDNASVSDTLTGLMLVYIDQQKYADAERLGRRALEIRQKKLGLDSVGVARALHNLSNVYAQTGRYLSAEDALKQALAIHEKRQGSNNHEVATTLENLAWVYQGEGRYAEAEPAFKKSLEILERIYGPEHALIGQCLCNLGSLYFHQHRFEDSEPVLTRALNVREKALGPNHPYVATTLSEIAKLRKYQGRFGEAERLLDRALAIDKSNGLAAPDLHIILGQLYQQEYLYKEAERHLAQGVAIGERVYGAANPQMIRGHLSLAAVYSQQGRYSDAETLFDQIIATCESSLGAEHSLMDAVICSKALLYDDQQRYVEEEPLLKKAIALEEKAHGHSNATTLNNLAWLYIHEERYDEARPLIDQAIKILEQTTKSAPSAAAIHFYDTRAQLEWKTGRRDAAVADLNHALQAADLLRAIISGAETERAEFLGYFSSDSELMLNWQNQLGHPVEAFSAAERSRSRTLVDQINLQGTDLFAGLPADQAKQLKDRDTAAQANVASLEKQLEILPKRQDYTDAQKKSEEQRLTEALKAAREEQVATYRDIRNASPAYRLMVGQDFKPIALDTLHHWVQDQHALLLQYFLGDEGGYLFILGDGQPQIVKLETNEEQAKELGTEVGPLTAKRLKAALTIEGQELPLKVAQVEKDLAVTQRLAALWKLLIPEAQREALTNAKYQRLILVPDGALVNLPFETLVLEPGENPTYLLDKGPPIVEGPSATLLYNLAQRPQNANKTGVLTVGDPNYPASSALVNNNNDNASRSATELLASFQPGARYASRGHLQSLPYTGRESSWVSDAFQKIGIAVGKLQKTDATESKVRQQVSGKQIIHLACHGLVDNEHGNFFGALALTPGSKGSADPSDDGFLTLPEIYELNLKGCELAILSACQTNYGPEQRGEGVWALSRGFLVAGSRRVVASNWLVDDEAAASLVYAFCTKIAQQQQAGGTVDYAQALHDAKLWARNQDKWQRPYYWATFTLVGPN
jgi:CHAT domain-containing protein